MKILRGALAAMTAMLRLIRVAVDHAVPGDGHVPQKRLDLEVGFRKFEPLVWTRVTDR
jgi:hypothetical protein